jgi:hypothetical protein
MRRYPSFVQVFGFVGANHPLFTQDFLEMKRSGSVTVFRSGNRWRGAYFQVGRVSVDSENKILER